MEERGDGESVPQPPPPVPRRRLEACSSNHSEFTTTHHVTAGWVGGMNVVSRGEARGKSKLSKALWSFITLFSLLYAAGFALDYYGVWDPCAIRIPYQSRCSMDTYAGGLIHKAEYVEDSFCVIPGIFHTSRSTGWNVDCTEHPELTKAVEPAH